jgi:hypothetical protein
VTAGASSLDPIAVLVRGYLIEHVRSLAEADPALFDKAFALYDTLERHHERAGPEHLHHLRDHPLLDRVLGLLGRRAHHVHAAAVRVTQDNERIVERLRERVAELGIDPTTPSGWREATSEYERILAQEVPLETSLDNVAAVADAVELSNDFLNARSVLKRGAFQAAWAVLLPLAVRDAEVRAEVEGLKRELSGDRRRLAEMAGLIRREGPRIVREAYARGGEAAGDVLTSPGSRRARRARGTGDTGS